jgi:hypothetical protein
MLLLVLLLLLDGAPEEDLGRVSGGLVKHADVERHREPPSACGKALRNSHVALNGSVEKVQRP